MPFPHRNGTGLDPVKRIDGEDARLSQDHDGATSTGYDKENLSLGTFLKRM
ncbi:hypothetical protein [Streptomyces sp. NPDC059176]|uniref:hypothetical protein n=1 Tax=Streptomyces sp. NPDC059176 TaxID=3346758 RepID=UPI003688ABF3